MKLFDLPPAPNPRRARIFIAEKGLDIPIVPVDIAAGENRTPEFLERRNPFGGLPVLELDDGTCISESIAICRYLESLHPDPPLFGTDPLDRAMVEMWNRRMELEVFRPVGDFFRNTAGLFADRYHQSPDAAEEARRIARERLEWLDGVLSRTPFAAGARFTVADITALVAVDLGTPSVFEIAPDQQHLARWHREISSRPSAAA